MSSQRQTLAQYLQKHEAKKFFKQAKKCPAPSLCFGKTIPEEVEKKKKFVNALMNEILAKVKRNVPDPKKSLEIEQMFKISCEQINNQFDSIFDHLNTECPMHVENIRTMSKIDSFSQTFSQMSYNNMTSPGKTKVLTQKNLNKKMNFQQSGSHFGATLQVPLIQVKNPLVSMRKNVSKQNIQGFYSHNVSVNSEQCQQNQQGAINRAERDVMNQGFSHKTDKNHLHKFKVSKTLSKKPGHISANLAQVYPNFSETIGNCKQFRVLPGM